MMKTTIKLISLVALAAIIAGCTEKNDYGAPDKSKYIYDIPQTDLENDAVVGVYYTDYSSSSVSDSKSAEIPFLGYYKTTDPMVLPYHVAWADTAKIDFFIFPWDASSSNNTLVANFKAAREAADADVRFVYCYSTSHLSITDDAPLQSEEKYKAFLSDFVDVLAEQMLSDAYYCIDGRPVILFTPCNLSSDKLLSVDFKTVMKNFKDDFKSFYGVEPYVIGQMTTGWVAPVNYADHQVYSFDAYTLNSWKTKSYDIFYGFFSFLDINWNNWKTTLAKRSVDFVPCIYPSFNDRKYSSSSYYYTFGNGGDPADYIKFCNVAKRNVGSRNFVFINSWNDWNYGTNLEPSEQKAKEDENGDFDYLHYLKLTRQQFKK